MAESTNPQTPEEAAVLRALAATHRHRWYALFCSVIASVHTTLILYLIWQDWPLASRDLGPLALLVVNVLGSLCAPQKFHPRGSGHDTT